MINYQLRKQIFDLLTEDYYGLWELTGLAEAPPIDELIHVLDGMIEERMVEIYIGSKFASEERILGEDEARRAIQNRAYWDWAAPEKGEHLRAFATRSGADWYFGQPP